MTQNNMNKQNCIFWVGVKPADEYFQKKHGNFKYLDISEKCWRAWCKKNDVTFVHYNVNDLKLKPVRWNAPTWTRWFDVFDVLEDRGITPNKIAVIDGSSLVHPDTPNFFKLVPDTGVTAFRSLENLTWIHQGIKGYKNFFKGFEFDMTKYFSCGFQIFTSEHRPFLEKLKELYTKNHTAIMHLQNEVVKRGTDQPVYNYLAQIEGIEMHLDVLPKRYMITHLQRFDWLQNNWQLKTPIPHFIKHGYIWFFSGFTDRGARENLMKQTWEIIKDGYTT